MKDRIMLHAVLSVCFEMICKCLEKFRSRVIYSSYVYCEIIITVNMQCHFTFDIFVFFQSLLEFKYLLYK